MSQFAVARSGSFVFLNSQTRLTVVTKVETSVSTDSSKPDDPNEHKHPNAGAQDASQLERGTYEIIRNRLLNHAEDLRSRVHELNELRRDVFGSIPTELVGTQRITTSNNCTAQDIVSVGSKFIFGYNVHMGLKSTTNLSDVFSVYEFAEDGNFHALENDILQDANFQHDFDQLYKYYKDTRFAKFQVKGPHLYMVFQVGKSVDDIKAFKFLMNGDNLKYIDSRSDHEAAFPPQHDFKWVRTHRDLHRSGEHPHISIQDRVFVETVGGDLTIKVEDNTDDGEGIYNEPVDDPDQTLDDAEIYYSIVGNIILLKMKPFKEDKFRYIVFNEKIQTATRLDTIEDACILLPEDHGLMFSNGYYLQNGQHKAFESQLNNLKFERRIAAPNGEDFMYVFFSRESGHYVLLSYNMIEQQVQTPIICNGFTLFDNGHLIYFKADESPQKHHGIQIWQTPYVGEDYQTSTKTDSYIFKIGNRDIVRAMAEANELIGLINQDDSYANLYVDLVKKSTDIVDSYFWLADKNAFNLAEPLIEIREAATAAVDEFDKVVRVRKNTAAQFESAKKAAKEAITTAASRHMQEIHDFVKSLSELRLVRGQVISLKELKYVDLAAVDSIENDVVENTDRLSHRCVEFLLKKNSLKPYADKVDTIRESIESIETGAQSKALTEEIAQGSSQLEMLIDIVSNLKIENAGDRTQIIDNISQIYSSLNQTRAALKKQSRKIMEVEGAAEFNSQLKLLSQAVVNYLDVCDTPDRCDEYLTKMMVQVEEIEGRFAEFDEYIVQLAEKREEIYAAFDSKKLQLSEARNRRSTALMSAADRILNGIRSRVSNFETVDEINSYFASDLMIDKVRNIIDQLAELDESVKVDDIQSRLKTTREDSVRQLRDKNELYVGGQNVIQFGEHKFSVNVQPLDLTTVIKDDNMLFHLSGTNYFETITDPQLLATRNVWDQSVVSENRQVYRAEFLAWQILKSIRAGETELQSTDDIATALQKIVPDFMAPRYSEGYVKGVHDHDAAKILHQLIKLDRDLDLLKYSPDTRALANVFWHSASHGELMSLKKSLATRLASLGNARKLFGEVSGQESYVEQLEPRVRELAVRLETFDADSARSAANYLVDQLSIDHKPVCSAEAFHLCQEFEKFLKRKGAFESFKDSVSAKTLSAVDQFQLTRQWLESFVENVLVTTEQSAIQNAGDFISESAAMLLDRSYGKRHVVDASPRSTIAGMLGEHPLINSQEYQLDFHDFNMRLEQFENDIVPAFEAYHQVKKQVIDNRRDSLRLEEFKPKVLTSFVRNKLINDVYLPMVGANLAKQMGVVGEDKRTDLMGLLLLISPPGYGKTTLMEYIANRLGITFMKINGPAIGHQVTSLDPAEAPNASAREEIEKLNLSLEMGDNVMIYLDDIQHCNPEFLQKFISLCDATRRIEGVFQGRTRTYDLRGRKVCVVMAGNPYTESGEKFQIPDMLSNRADTYNLGDVIGDNSSSFDLSYLENCITSNPTLGRLNSRSRNDIYSIIKMAEQDEPTGITLEGNYSIEEISEFVDVMRKLLKVRNVILRVNRQYIDSAAQADEYRTEPAFKLQGSYRDMNKIAERVASIMNDEELDTLIKSHYENQAQTLTTGAEANLLKFAELIGQLNDEEKSRWDDIKRTFKRNLLLGSASKDDQFGQIIAQMTTFSDGLHDIRKAVESGVNRITEIGKEDEGSETLQAVTIREIGHAVAELVKFNEKLGAIHETMDNSVRQEAESQSSGDKKIQIINKVPNAFVEVMRNQFRVLQTWMEPLIRVAESLPEAEGLVQAAKKTEKSYEKMIERIEGQDEDLDIED